MLTFFFTTNAKTISIQCYLRCRKVTIFKLSLREIQLANMCGKLCVAAIFLRNLLNFFPTLWRTHPARGIIATTTKPVCAGWRVEKCCHLIVRRNHSNAKEQLITSHWSVKYEKKTTFYVKYLLNFTLNGTPASAMHATAFTSSEKRLNYQWSEWKSGCHWKYALKATLRAPIYRKHACNKVTLFNSDVDLIWWQNKNSLIMFACLFCHIHVCARLCIQYIVCIFYSAKWSDNGWFSTIVAWTTQQFTDWIFY